MSRIRSNDLSTSSPLMMDAVFQHFGQTTPGSVRHQFADEERKRIRQTK